MANENIGKVAALDKIQVAALRKADNAVSFHRTAEGDAYAIASKRCEATEADPFAPREREMRIPCEYQLTEYRGDGRHHRWGENAKDDYTCFAMVHTPQYHEHWRTVAELIKPGDVLRLHWNIGAWSSPFLRERGLTSGYFNVEIVRGDRLLCFFMDHEIRVENSMFAMLKG